MLGQIQLCNDIHANDLLVLPAASNPNIRMRISLVPNILFNAFDMLAPIMYNWNIERKREKRQTCHSIFPFESSASLIPLISFVHHYVCELNNLKKKVVCYKETYLRLTDFYWQQSFFFLSSFQNTSFLCTR